MRPPLPRAIASNWFGTIFGDIRLPDRGQGTVSDRVTTSKRDIGALIDVFRRAKSRSGPFLRPDDLDAIALVIEQRPTTRHELEKAPDL